MPLPPYAAGTAYMPYGGGVLIGSMDQSSQATTVKLKNCIFENNTAADGAAIRNHAGYVNVKLELENCVINNNTSKKDPLNASPSELRFHHLSEQECRQQQLSHSTT